MEKIPFTQAGLEKLKDNHYTNENRCHSSCSASEKGSIWIEKENRSGIDPD